MKKAALIEFNTYHDECLYSQIKFLKDSGYSVTLIVSPQILERAKEYLYLTEDVFIYDSSKSTKNIFNRIVSIFKLSRHILSTKLETVIFNTASSKLEVILLSNLLKRKVKLFGVLHNLKKANHSLSQKLINKAVKKFYVLNDFLEDSITLKDKSIQLSSFYPIFFPEYNTSPLPKTKDEIWIGIPGKLDFNRRDYDLIVDVLLMMKSREKLKFLILGKTDRKDSNNKPFLEQLKINNILENFMLFDSFIENNLFHQYVSKSDYILLPSKSIGDNYLKYKIMGNYNLAFAYKKTLIGPIGLKHIEDINSQSVLYNDSVHLSEILKDIQENKEKYKRSYDSKKWAFNEQKKKYIKFLESK